VKRRFEFLLFDLDGTLVDPREGISRSVQYALQKLGKTEIPDEADLLWTIGPPLRENMAKLLGNDNKELIEKGAAYYRERFGDLGIYENVVYSGVVEVLNRLKQEGFHLYLATSKPHLFAVRILKYFNLLAYFDKVYGSEFDGTRSDKGQLLEYLLTEEMIKADNALMIGDRMHDIRAARQNNMASAGVTYGYGALEELINSGADYIINRPEDLLELVWMED
jgi:phosphoglycolate phosphatase